MFYQLSQPDAPRKILDFDSGSIREVLVKAVITPKVVRWEAANFINCVSDICYRCYFLEQVKERFLLYTVQQVLWCFHGWSSNPDNLFVVIHIQVWGYCDIVFSFCLMQKTLNIILDGQHWLIVVWSSRFINLVLKLPSHPPSGRYNLPSNLLVGRKVSLT